MENQENLKTQMSAIGKTVSEADKGILQKIADALNKGTKEDINTAKSLTDSSSFSFEPMTSDESKNLLVKVINDEYLSALKSKLGATLYDFSKFQRDGSPFYLLFIRGGQVP